ncbi:MAG TPA: sigma-70 family RNA polymerase sigma factor [Beijerinckiaceae bacterium]|nr:sigma-70 family RNA polymerase sigma factor [Beijerinckiaceae bacterium]
MAERGSDLWGDMMGRALAGDEATYRQLLMAMTPVLRAIVRRSAAQHGGGETEDIVQDILLAVHLKRGNWDRSQPFRPWLFGVARHKIIDAYRRRGRTVAVPLEDVEHELEAAPAPAADDAREAEHWLSRLGERDRAIVRAIAIEERPTLEVSRSLGMQEGAVRVALHRALKKLAAFARGEAQ